MPNIQIDRSRRLAVLEAHRLWARSLPREPGQIGGTISDLVEGPPVYTPGEIMPYSDFDPIRFVGVHPSFVDFLRMQGIPFQEK
jgi:hypothetical protein